MRTTLTIDDDVEALLRQRLRASGEPLKQAVNKYLRLGMQAEAKPVKRKPFKVKPVSFAMPRINTDKTSSWLDYLDQLDRAESK